MPLIKKLTPLFSTLLLYLVFYLISTFKFDVQIPARGEEKISYRVRVRWC